MVHSLLRRPLAKAGAGPNVTDFERALENSEFMLPGLTAVQFSREDRFRGEIREALNEGNDRRAEVAILAAPT